MSQAVGQPVDASTILVAVHPVTLDEDPIAQGRAVFTALESIDAPMVVCFPNADAGGRPKLGRRFVQNVPTPPKWSTFPAHLVGLLETSVGVGGQLQQRGHGEHHRWTPAIDVGNRQEGRERGVNVLSVPADPSAIRSALSQARLKVFRVQAKEAKSPYGDGTAAMKMAKILADLPDRNTLLKKPVIPLLEDARRFQSDRRRRLSEAFSGWGCGKRLCAPCHSECVPKRSWR